jgi:hypothetical protein
MKITITSKEVINTPNDQELGALVRQKFWLAKSNQDENLVLVSKDSGEVTSIEELMFKCSICEGNTGDVDYEYLVGTDHLACVLTKEAQQKNEFDKCVICGKESPYKASTHIDLRDGYVEGAGQGCFQPLFCNK